MRRTLLGENITRAEATTMGIILGVAIVLGFIMRDPNFNGADAVSYNTFALDAQDWSYWLDPQAFYETYFPMGYPSLLALAVKLSPGSYWAPQVISILLIPVLCLIGWVLTSHISRAARLTTMGAIAISPSVIWMSQNNGYEMLVSFLACSAFAIAWKGPRLGSTSLLVRCGGPVIAGLFIGTAVLTEAPALAFVPLLAYLTFAWGRVQGLFFVSSAAILPAIWTLRNIVILGRWSPLSTNGPLVFWHGNNGVTTTGGVQEALIPPPPGTTTLTDAAITFILSQPEAAYSLLLRRVMRLLEPTYMYRDISDVAGVNLLPHVYAIAFSAVGILLFVAYSFGRLWVGPPTLPRVGPAAVFVLSFFAFFLPFQSEPRYLAPVVPVALAVAVPTAFALWNHRVAPMRRRTVSRTLLRITSHTSPYDR